MVDGEETFVFFFLPPVDMFVSIFHELFKGFIEISDSTG